MAYIYSGETVFLAFHFPVGVSRDHKNGDLTAYLGEVFGGDAVRIVESRSNEQETTYAIRLDRIKGDGSNEAIFKSFRRVLAAKSAMTPHFTHIPNWSTDD